VSTGSFLTRYSNGHNISSIEEDSLLFLTQYYYSNLYKNKLWSSH